MEDKYIELLIKRCINFDKSKSLLITCDKVNLTFVNKVVEKIKEMGINDIYLDVDDINVTHEKLSNLSLKDLEKDKYFDKSIWDEYAKKDATFLMFDTEFPHIMDDIDPKKITKMKEINRKTRPIFRKKESTMEISWCIAALPNKIWAKELFLDDEKSLEKLENLIYKCCMVDRDNPIKSWNEYLEECKLLADKLNNLKIKKLHYTNSLGTNLEVELPKNSIWISAGSEGDNSICNMPTYEIFSSPNYKKVNGIVYNALPLYYGGGKVDEFYIKFKDGKVIEYDALVGKDILKGIIESDSNSCHLGEIALVNNDSPISNTKVVFGTTLFDENASCHLALGDGFPECILDGCKMTKDELLKNNINQSTNHVDFMIGTPDLEIEAETENGRVKIFTKGNFDENLKNNLKFM